MALPADFQKLRGPSLRNALKKSSVAVIGLGKSGLSAVRLLLDMRANVFISEVNPKVKVRDLPEFLRDAVDQGKVEIETGEHSSKILKNDLIIVSPGADWNMPLLEKARGKGLVVWTEIELGVRLVQTGPIAAVTGTNGKSTTVSLLADMCARAQRKTLLAGNIGRPLCDFALSDEAFEASVLEVSSYQLEGVDSFHPKVAAVLNLTDDHLQHHKTMENYFEAKARIFMNQTPQDVAILNYDDPWCRNMRDRTKASIRWISTQTHLKDGVYYDERRKKIASKNGSTFNEYPLPAHLPGLHNVENSCAAVAAAIALGISDRDIITSLLQFQGVEHRIETVRTLRGVAYVNDSKATNVDSTMKALLSFERPMWLILGGQDKGGSYKPIKNFILQSQRKNNKVRGVALIGEAAAKIKKELGSACEMLDSGTLENAVRQLQEKAGEGDVVLLSPACASFDQFQNFEDRGRQFKRFVADLPA